jgi:hypothetical protein
MADIVNDVPLVGIFTEVMISNVEGLQKEMIFYSAGTNVSIQNKCVDTYEQQSEVLDSVTDAINIDIMNVRKHADGLEALDLRLAGEIENGW